MNEIKVKNIVAIFVMLCNTAISEAQIVLPRLISDGMVLQRDTSVRIWGWAGIKEKVKVGFLDTVLFTEAGPDGKWEVILPPCEAGGPYEMKIAAPDTIILRNILVGEVWLCSGQSNMELNMRRASPLYKKEIESSTNEFIRHFTVPKTADFTGPGENITAGKWIPANPESIMDFSAVAYFFARELYEKYGIPVGLINASLGGTPAEAWMSLEALKEFPDYYNEAVRFSDSSLIQKITNDDRIRIDAWYNELANKDEGYKDGGGRWNSPDIDTSGWDNAIVPGLWSETGPGQVNGVVWYRRDFELPGNVSDRPALLLLGRIVDADSVFVNGIYVGSTSYQYPPRRYNIPPGVLKPGRNKITVRIISNSGTGGFVPDKPYEIGVDGHVTDLKGEWFYRIGAVMKPLQGQTFITYKPSGLYNAMIAPLSQYTIRGVLWYQGESNAGRASEYSGLLKALINDWRKTWVSEKMPFLVVQLPNYGQPAISPDEKSEWAVMREAQFSALELPNTGVVVTIDIGEWNDIHPLNKKDVGGRLALLARGVVYEEPDIVFSGPVYDSYRIKGRKVIISFTSAGSGLIVKGGGRPLAFAIAGDDRHFVWGRARIRRNCVIVRGRGIRNPVSVRYAWADNPAGANLFNREGLPAGPFRTDTWSDN